MWGIVGCKRQRVVGQNGRGECRGERDEGRGGMIDGSESGRMKMGKRGGGEGCVRGGVEEWRGWGWTGGRMRGWKNGRMRGW